MSLLLYSSVIITHHYIHTSLIYMSDILYVFTVIQFGNHNTPLHTYITDPCRTYYMSLLLYSPGNHNTPLHTYITDPCRTYYMSLLLYSSVIITHHYIHTYIHHWSMSDILYVFTVIQFCNHNTPLHTYITDPCRTYYMSLLLYSSVIITHHYIHTSLIYMTDIWYVFTVIQFGNLNTPLHTYITDPCRTYYMSLLLYSSVIITHHYIHTSLIYMSDILYVFTVIQFGNHNTPLHTYITDQCWAYYMSLLLYSSVIITHHYIHTSLIYNVGHIICLYCYTIR